MKPLLTLVALCLLLAGCVAPIRPALNDRFPDYCDLTQPDKQGTGYTVGQFPCRLQHHEGKVQP